MIAWKTGCNVNAYSLKACMELLFALQHLNFTHLVSNRLEPIVQDVCLVWWTYLVKWNKQPIEWLVRALLSLAVALLTIVSNNTTIELVIVLLARGPTRMVFLCLKLSWLIAVFLAYEAVIFIVDLYDAKSRVGCGFSTNRYMKVSCNIAVCEIVPWWLNSIV